MPLSMRSVRRNAVRAPLFDEARDRPVEALRGHFDKLSANGGVRGPFGLSPSKLCLGTGLSQHLAGTSTSSVRTGVFAGRSG
jgi:hypothetical protein